MIAFAIIAVLILASASLAMCLRNLVHSVLLLVACWAGIAAFYLWAGAEFVAFAQLLVYVGAVSMLSLFAVLLTRRSFHDLDILPESVTRATWALLTAGAVAGVLVGTILGSPLGKVAESAPAVSVRQLGEELAGPQVAGLLVVGIILTVALLGGVVIAAKDKEPKP
jgi:NADH:ubiquinone oxidoreductase subunit 6 (subunit J)